MYDESLEVPDAEDIPSVCTPSPNMATFGNQGDTNHLKNFYLPFISLFKVLLIRLNSSFEKKWKLSHKFGSVNYEEFFSFRSLQCFLICCLDFFTSLIDCQIFNE